MAEFDYQTLDVFTTERFGGNPLAVLPDARGLTLAQMQKIAAEFNYSETTFVTPSEQGLGPRVRIFTPKAELPFAGHPTVGTAIVLRGLGLLDLENAILEETAGPVPIHFKSPNRVSFQAPGLPVIEPVGTREDAARTLSLPLECILGQPMNAGAGLVFPFAQLRDMAALRAVRMSGADSPFAGEIVVFVERPNGRLAVRVFAPAHNIIEDPATGSAAAGLAVLLASRHSELDAELAWTIDQGVEMGRPSEIGIRVIKRGGDIAEVHVEGSAIAVAQGRIQV